MCLLRNLAQRMAQQIGEQVMVAIPAALVIQGDQEQIRTFHLSSITWESSAGRVFPSCISAPTASQRGAENLSRIEVANKNFWISSGCRVNTSSIK